MLAEGLLAHVDLDAPHPDAAADVHIDGIRGSCRHDIAPQVAVAGAHYAPRNSELLYGLFPYFGKGPDRVRSVEADRVRPLHELDHFDELLSGLDGADVVLPAPQTLREVDLAQTRLLALSNKKAAQQVVPG
jgi:hypothetical protein